MNEGNSCCEPVQLARTLSLQQSLNDAEKRFARPSLSETDSLCEDWSYFLFRLQSISGYRTLSFRHDSLSAPHLPFLFDQSPPACSFPVLLGKSLLIYSIFLFFFSLFVTILHRPLFSLCLSSRAIFLLFYVVPSRIRLLSNVFS